MGISVAGGLGPQDPLLWLPHYPGLWALRLEGWIPGSPCCYCWGVPGLRLTAAAGEQDHELPLLHFPHSASVWVPAHPLYAHCVGFSASWGVGQRHLCFVVHVYRLWMEGERQERLFAPSFSSGSSFMSRDMQFCLAGGLAQLEPVGLWGASQTCDPQVLGQHQGQKLDLGPGLQGL